VREGRNPNYFVPIKGYAPVVIGVVTHLPNQEGYHKERFEVIQCSLETLRANAGADCEIFIWDNGSCASLKGWFINSFRPDYLMLSRNVGKSIGRASMANMLPDDTIVGYADDDMFYYPDWLSKQLEVLNTYPNVGTVSGWPVRTQFRFHNKSTIAWGKANADKFERGRFISEQEDRDFCTAIGRDYEGHQVPYTQNDIDTKLTYKGVEVYATGHHCQFISRAGTIAPLLDYDEMAMSRERTFEEALDSAGLLRLTTFERNTRHIGNILDEELRQLWHDYVT
jgi:hypothetical protein